MKPAAIAFALFATLWCYALRGPLTTILVGMLAVLLTVVLALREEDL